MFPLCQVSTIVVVTFFSKFSFDTVVIHFYQVLLKTLKKWLFFPVLLISVRLPRIPVLPPVAVLRLRPPTFLPVAVLQVWISRPPRIHLHKIRGIQIRYHHRRHVIILRVRAIRAQHHHHHRVRVLRIIRAHRFI